MLDEAFELLKLRVGLPADRLDLQAPRWTRAAGDDAAWVGEICEGGGCVMLALRCSVRLVAAGLGDVIFSLCCRLRSLPLVFPFGRRPPFARLRLSSLRTATRADANMPKQPESGRVASRIRIETHIYTDTTMTRLMSTRPADSPRQSTSAGPVEAIQPMHRCEPERHMPSEAQLLQLQHHAPYPWPRSAGRVSCCACAAGTSRCGMSIHSADAT
jgi:hypothetical protein